MNSAQLSNQAKCLVFSLIVLANSFCSAQSVSTTTSKIPPSDKAKRQETVELEDKHKDSLRKTLAQPVLLRFDEVPFLEVKRTLEEQFNIVINLDLSAKGALPEDQELLSFESNKPLRLETALELMFRPFNSTICCKNNIVHIISIDCADTAEYHMQRVFDCRKMILAIAENRLKDYASDPEPPKAWEEKMVVEEELIEMLKQTVAPNTWDSPNGENGEASLAGLDGILVCSQSYCNIRKIETLLDQLGQIFKIDSN